jgi:hypothetical protein
MDRASDIHTIRLLTNDVAAVLGFIVFGGLIFEVLSRLFGQ